MRLKTLLEFIEIQTKLASLLPFIFGVLYAYFLGFEINIVNTIYMFVSLISLDMATTAINNYMDFQKAKNDEYKIYENVLGKENIANKLALTIIFSLIALCIFFGLLLVIRTNVIVLLLGSFSFCIGVLYTYGPIPISRTPFGEIVSGFVMGFLIPFITIYVQNLDIIVIEYFWKSENLVVNMEINKILKIIVATSPFILNISNIMLGNNLYDLKTDIKNDRFLLPYHLGVKKSLRLFKFKYILCYVMIGISIILKIVPITCIITFIFLPTILKNIKLYSENLSAKHKKDCFKFVVINMLITSTVYTLSFGLGLLFI